MSDWKLGYLRRLWKANKLLFDPDTVVDSPSVIGRRRQCFCDTVRSKLGLDPSDMKASQSPPVVLIHAPDDCSGDAKIDERGRFVAGKPECSKCEMLGESRFGDSLLTFENSRAPRAAPL